MGIAGAYDMTKVQRNPAKMLDDRSRALQAERKIAYTQGIWLGLWAGVLGTNAAWILIAVM